MAADSRRDSIALGAAACARVAPVAGGAFFRQVVGERGIEVTLDPTHPFHDRFEPIRRRDPAAAALILELLRTHRGGDIEGWSRRLAEVV